MEVYILDSLYRRIQVVDRFESLIWTERFADLGDFELKMHSTLENRTRFSPGTKLAMNLSKRGMTVETVEDTTDEEGKRMLTVKGPSFEKIFDNRLTSPPGFTNSTAKWSITDTPINIVKKIVRDICILGLRDVSDIIPGILEGLGPYPEDTIAEPSDMVLAELDFMTVYSAIKQLADLYGFGFRLIRQDDTGRLYFDVYMGSDRTSGQTTLPPVIFSPNLDNVKNTTELTTIDGYKNIAVVVSPVGFEAVYADDIDPSIDGFERRLLLVKADDITDTVPATATAKMIQRGKEELSKARRLQAFDGEISQNSQYVYERDYNLGDIFDVQNTDGFINAMQVTEQIFVQDREGERSYPTLSLNKFITPGSWSAWDFNQQWVDLSADPLTWSEA